MRPHQPELVRAVAVANQYIRLLDRATPTNAGSDLRRLVRGWCDGATPAPEPEYGPPFDPSELLVALDGLIGWTATWDLPDRLVTAKLEELHTEARLGAMVGASDFCALARQRYSLPEGLPTERADLLAGEWMSLSEPSKEECHRSNAVLDPESLHRQIEARLSLYQLQWKISADGRWPTLASVSPLIVHYCPEILLSTHLARSLAVHEVDGHAVPLSRAAWQTPLLARVGSAQGMEDQEGRAVRLEEQVTGLPAQRRRNLASRHLAARCCRDGANYVESVRELIRRGCDAELATIAAYRVHRGGGLAREIVYLPSYLAFLALEEHEPLAAAWMAAGALGFDAARELARLDLVPKLGAG